jgi:hypothetical protein
MRSIIKAEVSQHTLKLQQLGAKVEVINSTLCYVNFDVCGFVIQYVYNINRKGNYFLERTKPYPLALEEFGNEKDVVKVIKSDVNKFKNALKCHHIDSFITIAREIESTYRVFEETFLNYNIPGEKVDKIHKKIQALTMEIEIIKENAEMLFENSKNNTDANS